MKIVRSYLHRALPAHFKDPVGLLIRILRSQNSAALFAITTSVLTIMLTPIDAAMSIFEKTLYRKASKPTLPLIFVTGPPRSGTTLAAQLLINNLPVSYLNNLSAIFQRSPIVANMLFKNVLKGKHSSYESYYGKTFSFSGPNDGLHIWDRWMGKDRTRIPDCITEKAKEDMLSFFGAYENAFRKPLVTKNNNLTTYAKLIADALPNAYFICMTREPSYLAQSLLLARSEIHGDTRVPYGIHHSNRINQMGHTQDHIKDVCEQVIFHEEMIRNQQRMIGTERFWIVSYENLCDKPQGLVKRVSEDILGHPCDHNQLRDTLKPFHSTNSVKIEKKVFLTMQDILYSLRNNKINNI